MFGTHSFEFVFPFIFTLLNFPQNIYTKNSILLDRDGAKENSKTPTRPAISCYLTIIL